ncbi:MAG: hypothetical protein VB137_06635 [Burkholderia sp.]
MAKRTQEAQSSPNVVARLKAQWVQEFEQWNKRDLSGSRRRPIRG